MSKLCPWGISDDTPISWDLLEARLEGKPLVLVLTKRQISNWDLVCEAKSNYPRPNFEIVAQQDIPTT